MLLKCPQCSSQLRPPIFGDRQICDQCGWASYAQSETIEAPPNSDASLIKQIAIGLTGIALAGFGLIAAATFLPRHLSLISPDKQSEQSALSHIGAVNRAQQAFRLEHNAFTISYRDLWFDDDRFDADSVEGYSIPITRADTKFSIVKAIPKRDSLRAYAGAVIEKEGLTTSIFCRSEKFGQEISDPVVVKGVLKCGPGSM
jgi:Type IV pilin-like G and H, putative